MNNKNMIINLTVIIPEYYENNHPLDDIMLLALKDFKIDVETYKTLSLKSLYKLTSNIINNSYENDLNRLYVSQNILLSNKRSPMATNYLIFKKNKKVSFSNKIDVFYIKSEHSKIKDVDFACNKYEKKFKNLFNEYDNYILNDKLCGLI